MTLVNYFYILMIVFIIISIGVQLFYRERYKALLEWSKNNIGQSYFEMIVQVRKKDRTAGNLLLIAVIMQAVAALVLIVTFYL